MILPITIFLVGLLSAFGFTGVDLSVSTTSADWQCLASDHNVTYAIIRVYRSVGLVDSNSPTTLHTAASVGIKDLGVYMFPCMPTSTYSMNKQVVCAEPEQQVIDTVTFLKENKVIVDRSVDKKSLNSGYTMVNRVWLDVEDESPSTYYDANPVKNQEFMARIVAQLEKMNIPVGIYTTKTYWQNIMGNILGYGDKYPLWYPRYDDVSTLDFFVPFADFNEVKIKQTAGDSGFCGISQVDTDYREVESI
jgi:GH25 family lysozyme M1 (1,4-beta-N-acetylmuramidase)